MSITLTLSSGRPINEKRKRKDTPLFIKYLQTAFFESYTAIAMWRLAMAKWSHCKETSFFLIFNSFLFVYCENSNKFGHSLVSVKHIWAINTIPTVISICAGNITFGYCTDLASSVARDLGQYLIMIMMIMIMNLFRHIHFTWNWLFVRKLYIQKRNTVQWDTVK